MPNYTSPFYTFYALTHEIIEVDPVTGLHQVSVTITLIGTGRTQDTLYEGYFTIDPGSTVDPGCTVEVVWENPSIRPLHPLFLVPSPGMEIMARVYRCEATEALASVDAESS